MQRNRPAQPKIKIGESIILDLSRLPIHQRRCQDKIFLENLPVFFPELDIPFQIVIIKLLIIIHEQEIFAGSGLDTDVPQSARIIMGNAMRQIGDITKSSHVRHFFTRIKLFVHDEDDLKIPERLSLQAFDDIFHVLISPRRDDDTELHTVCRI